MKELSKLREERRLSETTITKLKLLEGYKFRVEFDVDDMPNLIVDELKPIGQGSGPNPTRLLSAAVGNCLSSSLLYCLSKARVRAKNLETTVKTEIGTNEEGRLRVKNLDVQIHLEVEDEDKVRVPRCLEIFENYCTVTPSVRKGIEVNVNYVL
jgi:organic hydroperoxide reductase OsmC/OhrA